MEDLVRLLTLQDPNTRVVLLGTALLGVASGVIGSFAVLRRRALVGDALAHAALPGLCVAYLIVGDKSFIAFLLGALAFGVLGVLCIAFIRTHTRIKEDAAIGIVLATFFGLGIVLSRNIQNQPTGNRAGLDTYIFGKAAAMVRQDVICIAVVAAVVLTVVVLLFKEFRALCFDRDFIAAQGWPVFSLDLLLMGLLCICTVIGLPAVGVVLMAALLIIPGAAARFWTDDFFTMLCIAGAIGLVACLTGTAASALAVRLPAGPLVVVAATGCFLISMLLAPRRGVVADLVRRAKLRRQVGRQHVLRAMYELGERTGDANVTCTFDALLELRSWSPRALRRTLHRTIAAGLVDADATAYRLTPRGREEAVRVVRAHRLWEIYLIEEASIAPDHVDRDADQIEHVLPPSLVARLEARLRAEGRLPAPVPLSPHAPEEVPG